MMTLIKKHVIFKLSFLAFLKVFKLLSNKSINRTSLSREKYDGGNFIPTTCQRLQKKNALVEVSLIEPTEPRNTLI